MREKFIGMSSLFEDLLEELMHHGEVINFDPNGYWIKVLIKDFENVEEIKINLEHDFDCKMKVCSIN